MCNEKLGCDVDISELKTASALNENEILFSEDQSRYVVSLDCSMVKEFRKKAEKKGVSLFKIGSVAKEKISLNSASVDIIELTKLNEAVFEKKFS
jgi:phosphoribosylformylglycinamidine (FGAM) synthase-like enzyme